VALLPNEQKAKDLVLRVGQQRACRILNALTRRFERRYNKACDESMSPVNPEWIYKTELEVNLTFDLKIGLQLTDAFNTPKAAKERIAKRLEARKAIYAGRITKVAIPI
jgi:hypothetical protein